MGDRFEPTEEQRAALMKRFTRMPRSIAVVFAVVGLICGGLLIAVGFVSPTTELGPGLVVGAVAAAAVPIAFGEILKAVARGRTRRLLSGSLVRGHGRIRSIQRPGADGGATRLLLELTLPGGDAAKGTLSTYHHTDANEGDELSLWFAEDRGSFFPTDLDVICDPGVVRR